MSVNLRGTIWKAVSLAVCGLAATFAVAVLVTRHDTAAATPIESEITAAPVVDSTMATTVVGLPIADTRELGADPDPAAFDREGLESWWRTYQHSHRQASAN